MEKDECWETFLTSGKVTDYLSYRQATEKTERSPEGEAVVSGKNEPDDMVKQHAGFY
ncbi:MAG: hypothetical protein J6B19_03710 [Lachnospiraceae bacterium]|nr:hypothetical protein [Lachnospiraceae bacterium]